MSRELQDGWKPYPLLLLGNQDTDQLAVCSVLNFGLEIIRWFYAVDVKNLDSFELAAIKGDVLLELNNDCCKKAKLFKCVCVCARFD
jgi:hypothetical protein